MVDLKGLKKRIELVDVRLKTAHSTRERESDALKHLWEQIHGRFDEQTKEIGQLRSKVAELEDVRDDLLQLVQDLLSAVEGGLEAMTDETVPHIRQMADTLLNSATTDAQQVQNVALDSPSLKAEPSLDENSPQDELLAAIERSLNDADEFQEMEASPDQTISSALADSGTMIPDAVDSQSFTAAEVIDAGDISLRPVSPGIRSLVERLEGVTIQSADLDDDVEDSADEDELSRDLKEIEVLRGELMGLRERIAGGH